MVIHSIVTINLGAAVWMPQHRIPFVKTLDIFIAQSRG
jgi:hypothetical protein